jgi:hypothetical protein
MMMRLRRDFLLAACVFAMLPAAYAQTSPDPFGSPPPRQQGPDPFAGRPAQAGSQFGPSPQQFGPGPDPFAAPPQQMPPCVAEFTKLRNDAEKKGHAIQKASEQKASPKEACHLFTVFAAAEAKMIKYAVDNKTSCGVPDEVIKQLKAGHNRTTDIRTKICKVAEAPPRPAGPTLSDTLSSPIPNANNIRSGGGTFDTLTGSPLGK